MNLSLKIIFKLFTLSLILNYSLSAQISISANFGKEFSKNEISIYIMDYLTRNDSLLSKINADSNGIFSLNFSLNSPSILNFSLEGKSLFHTTVFQNDKILIVFNNKTWKISGGAESNILINYEAYRQSIYRKWLQPVYDSTAMATEMNDKSKIEFWNKAQSKASDNYKNDLSNWVKNTKMDTTFSAIHHSLRWHVDNDFNLINSILDNYQKKFSNYNYYSHLKLKVQKIQNTTIGAYAPNIKAKNFKGQIIDLHHFKGKFVLLDFWASWCGPCRQESPVIKRIYEKFKNRNFTILSVSVDTKYENWNDAISKDQYTWDNISDLKGWASQWAVLYGVSAIPSSFLIDSNGKIIAKKLRGTDLEFKLEQILPK